MRRRLLLALELRDKGGAVGECGGGCFFKGLCVGLFLCAAFGNAFEDGAVGFAHLAFAEQACKVGGGTTVFGNEQQTAGRTIDAVDKARHAERGVNLGESEQLSVERLDNASSALTGEPCGLV